MRYRLLTLALLASLTACAAEPSPPAGATPAPATEATATAAPAAAGEPAVRAAINALIPEAKISGITPAPFAGFSEAAVEGRVFYVSNDGKYLIQGQLVDVAGKENLTRRSEGVLRKDLLDAVGPERRIIFAAAQPKHRVTVFTDIDCGYCRRLHEHIADYNSRGITVEYLFFPRTGPTGESADKAASVWCAPDRLVAMTEAKAGKALPAGRCTNPVAMDYDLGRRIGIEGTPAIYAENGEQLGGYLPPEEMIARLDEMKAKGR